MNSASFRSNLASFVALRTASDVFFTSRVFSKPSSWMQELGENWWFQDRVLHQAASTGDSVTDQSRAANCELSSKLFKSFRSLVSWIPGRCYCSPSRLHQSQVLPAFKQWNRHSRELSLPFGVATHFNITLFSVFVIKSSLARHFVSNCMHVLSLALVSGLRLFFRVFASNLPKRLIVYRYLRCSHFEA